MTKKSKKAEKNKDETLLHTALTNSIRDLGERFNGSLDRIAAVSSHPTVTTAFEVVELKDRLTAVE